MGWVGILVIAVVVVMALFVLAGVLWFAFDSKKRVRAFAESTDLIPGKPSRAPAEWTTGTSREALLHQRIRYAIADVHANPALPHDESLMRLRDELDDAVFAIDDRLIASSQDADDEHRTEVLEAAEESITELEGLARKLWEAPAAQQAEDLKAVTTALRA